MDRIIKKSQTLADKNWFQTGGQAKFFCEPKNGSNFKEALAFSKKQKLEIFVLGEGSNLLVSDNGFNGLVIKPQNKEIIFDVKNSTASCGAGTKLSEFIEKSLENQLLGLEVFSGIPGTIGGAIFNNAHYLNFHVGDFLLEATVISKDTGECHKVDQDWFNFGYNKSRLYEEKFYLLSAKFKLKKSSEKESWFAMGQSHEIIRHRNMRYPTSNTCGSFFRNFLPNELKKGQLPFVAHYLENLGVKGSLKVGGASVYPRHANMIVTDGKNAISADIRTLARKMRDMVKEKFDLEPKPECRFLGFSEL